MALLNALLPRISLVALSRHEVRMADPKAQLIGTRDSKYAAIVRVVNRWGLKNEDGQYWGLLNGVIARISSRHRLLQIYEPVELLVFGKLLDAFRNGVVDAAFTMAELQVFFLQPYEMILCSHSAESAVHLYDLIRKCMTVSQRLKSDDSREFLNQGVCRRLLMLKASADSISRVYNQRRVEPLDGDENAILSQNVNFFYANVYAVLDCLAFVLAFECPTCTLDRANKDELKKVVLFKRSFYTQIKGLSEKVDIERAKPWYDTIVELRHPISHRIPLYFPEMHTNEDCTRIQELDDAYYRTVNAEWSGMVEVTEEHVEKMDTLHEQWQRARRDINVFSGCFLHSDKESKMLYHLSRLTLDLGILYYLLDASFDYLAEQAS